MCMKQTTWEQFTEDAVVAHSSGIFFVDGSLEERVAASGDIGYYIYTKESAYKKNLYKCGQTKAGCVSRIRQQKTAAEVENLYIIDWIPSDLPLSDSKSDEKIHKELDRRGLSEWTGYDAETSGAREWSVFPRNNPGEIWWDHLNGSQKRIDLSLTLWQQDAIRRIVTSLVEGNSTIMAELAARFGKTTTYLSLLDVLQCKVMVVGSYVLTVAASFKKECQTFSQFENIEFLELNSNILAAVEDKITVIDEADYGAHTEKKAPLVRKITGGSPLILTTGTNSERARGEHDVDDMFGTTYFDMLMMRDR
jgi:hypothetical protein